MMYVLLYSTWAFPQTFSKRRIKALDSNGYGRWSIDSRGLGLFPATMLYCRSYSILQCTVRNQLLIYANKTLAIHAMNITMDDHTLLRFRRRRTKNIIL